ncbi:MAG TPA: hypothetical protein VKT29_12515, partial [Terriglobales bacterium]|nr:hypothetical protein [Terriglobales bacterium]
SQGRFVHLHPLDARRNPEGKYFHLTNQAWFDGTKDDQDLLLWDLSKDIDKTPGGRLIGFYYYNHGPDTRLPACTAHSKAQADDAVKHPGCQLRMYYCGMGYPGDVHDRGLGHGPNAWASAGWPEALGIVRQKEIVEGQIDHGLILNTGCVVGDPVFPAQQNTQLCSTRKCQGGLKAYQSCRQDGDCPLGKCAPIDVSPYRPHTGSLLWIDNDYNCKALPAWQKPFCTALQTYGGYVSDTGGDYRGGFYVSRSEKGEAYFDAGIKPPPAFKFLSTQSGNGLQCFGDGAIAGTGGGQCNLPVFNMPGLRGHLHILDPCVAVRQAGLPRYKGVAACK